MAHIFRCLLISLGLLVVSSFGANKCLKADPCLCTLDEFFFIDISQVNLGPVFLEDRLGNFSYFFAGCQDREFNPTDYQLVTNTTLKSVSVSSSAICILDCFKGRISCRGSILRKEFEV